MDIEQLIERARQGDETAFAALYAAYRQRMEAICCRIVGRRDLAEELTHDAFVLAFAKLDALKSPRRFGAWLKTITTNVALRYKERHHEPQLLPLSSLQEERLAAVGATDGQDLPTMAELMAAIDRLPEGYRRIFKMSVMQDMSHKEIGAVLGIAAHTSSSQLARAKKMLQRQLSRYWLLWLLPLLAPVVFLLLKGKGADGEPELAATHEDKRPPRKPHPATAAPTDAPRRTATTPTYRHVARTAAPTDSLRPDASTDTLGTATPPPQPDAPQRDDTRPTPPPLPSEPPRERSAASWSVELAYSGSLNAAADQAMPGSLWAVAPGGKSPGIGSEAPEPDTATPKEAKRWSEVLEHLETADLPTAERDALKGIAQANIELGADEIKRTAHHDLPLSLELSVRRRLDRRWSLETGLGYTRLSSQFTTGVPQAAIVERQQISYLGVPLSASYHWLGTQTWNVYTSLGGALDIPLAARLTTGYRLNGTTYHSQQQSLHAPLQWSVGAGVGLQYNITPSIGIFAEPRLQYFIPTGDGPETYRTEHPLNVTLPVGLRFTW